jgi:hypothetical protein
MTAKENVLRKLFLAFLMDGFPLSRTDAGVPNKAQARQKVHSLSRNFKVHPTGPFAFEIVLAIRFLHSYGVVTRL